MSSGDEFGKSERPIEPAKTRSPAITRRVGHEAAVARRVSGRVLHPDRETRERQDVAVDHVPQVLHRLQRIVEARAPGVEVVERHGVGLWTKTGTSSPAKSPAA